MERVLYALAIGCLVGFTLWFLLPPPYWFIAPLGAFFATRLVR